MIFGLISSGTRRMQVSGRASKSYFVSLMKSWYGDNASAENNW